MKEIGRKLKEFLKRNLVIFKWTIEDIVGINSNVLYHPLKIILKSIPRIKAKALNSERYATSKEEVD